MFPPEATAWQALSGPECLRRLGVGEAGLSEAAAADRLASDGPNRLALPPGPGRWRILLDQFSNVMLVLLLAVAAVSAGLAVLDHAIPKDAIAILLIVALTALLGYLQESQALLALRSLLNLAQPLARVRRDGHWQRRPSDQLVPGDLIRLESGDRVPADARLLEGSELGLQEAALTGEAELVSKRPEPPLAADTPVVERSNCLFLGSEVGRGRGLAVVTATGMATVLGGIATLIHTARPEPTPLQKRLADLSGQLVAWALVLVAAVVLGGWLLGGSPLALLELALSTAVAIVPEGLPAVITVSLAIGTQRMVRRAALIRHLPAVEALGAITVICTDKTGTLTQNRQLVVEIRCGTQALDLVENGFEVRDLVPPPGAEAGLAPDDGNLLLLAGVLCNDAEPEQRGGMGDPTEVALLEAAARAGLEAASLRAKHPRSAEIPFRAERQRMAVWVSDPDGSLAAPLVEVPYGSSTAEASRLLIVKGAPEAILRDCDRWLDGAGARSLTPVQRDWWVAEARGLASSGLRVLAFACGPQHQGPEAAMGTLVLLGLMAQRDPPRPEVPGAVARCHGAGIRPVMVTGDHPLTARAISTAIGLAEPDSPIVLGMELEGLDDGELEAVVRRTSLFARVLPEQKLRIVRALQATGAVVAMTGDGVNDAPALRQAHVGVAMGISGSDVSREAADVVLLDDNFASIVNAVEEGRQVYANIRRFVRFILGCNLGELITIGSAPLLGLALTPLQILWINLVTDGLPALALALGPPAEDLMHQPPIEPGESLFARGLGSAILRTGLVFGALVVALMAVSARLGLPWQTMAFTTLCLAQLGHAFSAGSDRPLWRSPPLANPWLLGAVLATATLQLLLLYVAPMARFLGVTALSAGELAACGGVSLAFVAYLELEKRGALGLRHAGRSPHPPPAHEP
ncbi:MULTISPECIES: cation-transporting P-type ATPase [unclassified Cyanobium]|uniref:cation-translocating P-type ATPase n=1 Tax=unclassified Cyanobium TaxID=2627006 RepID=UPI0020CE2E3B|nr:MULTISPECIES: cation-transporting P-type ATPase [unclassified Cyanobium]MCP9859002.1 cation-transporting P-type ATPase [Cyanobium sp. Cruz-8H5]MCP9866238.1 cation-transporting P-type ATPase [Cyanobium sp. Cruz-8D1]